MLRPMRPRRWTRILAVCALALAAFAAARRGLGIDLDPESVRGAVEGLGVWGPLAFVGIMTFRVPLGVPSQLVLVGGGLLFGTVAGTLYGALGITLSAVLLFLGARWTGRAAIEARVPDRLRPLLDLSGSRVGAAFLVLGTGYPFGPITMYHFFAGLTGMTLPVFVVAVALGAAIRSATYTYFGSSLVVGDAAGLLQAVGLIALAALAPLALSRPRAWLLQAMGRGAPPPRGEPGAGEGPP
jgi:uncharacterized membrane protein YdjX (TVP38/TMEM64 family)